MAGSRDTYSRMCDDELLGLTAQWQSLTEPAKAALSAELEQRKLEWHSEEATRASHPPSRAKKDHTVPGFFLLAGLLCLCFYGYEGLRRYLGEVMDPGHPQIVTLDGIVHVVCRGDTKVETSGSGSSYDVRFTDNDGNRDAFIGVKKAEIVSLRNGQQPAECTQAAKP